MNIFIIIPCLNEEKTIKKILEKVLKTPTLNYKKEIIVIDDGSEDQTRKIVDDLKQKHSFSFLKHSKRQGKGAAIQTALKEIEKKNHTSKDLVIIQDADLEYNPNNIQELIEEYQKNKSIVYGSRYLKNFQRNNSLFVFGGQLLTKIMNLLLQTNLTDAYTCYKLIPLKTIKQLNLKSKGFEIEAEITTKIIKSGLQINETPIDYQPRKISQGKKIRIEDGIIGVWTTIKSLF